MNYISIGEISSGTLRPDDLIESYAWALRGVEVTASEQNIIDHAAGMEPDDDDIWEYVEELADICATYAPPYCYVGSHEGDGALIGCWPSVDSIREDIYTGDILPVSDLSEVPDDYSGYVAETNDHGNLSLYVVVNGEFTEVWSIV